MKTFKWRSLKGWKYETLEEMRVSVSIEPPAIETEYITLQAGILTVRTRYAYDGPSGPTFDTKTVMRTTLFHDALCQLIEMGLLDRKYRKYADDLLRKIMLEDIAAEVLLKAEWFRKTYLRWNTFRAWYWHVGVRAWSKFKGM